MLEKFDETKKPTIGELISVRLWFLLFEGFVIHSFDGASTWQLAGSPSGKS